jgi:S-adenosylmethionine synthetase
MSITLIDGFTHPSERRFETVERKGLGHPDTLADLLAEAFSRNYSRYCLEHFGHILNHAVDKMTLVGLSSRTYLGGFEVISPGQILMIGNITPAVGSRRIPVYDLLRRSAQQVFAAALVGDPILPYMNLQVVNTYSSAQDRPGNFFFPGSEDEAARVGEGERGANDTVFCTAVAPFSDLEQLVLELEETVTGPLGRERFPGVGTDVKVLATRLDNRVTITMCVPILPQAAGARHDYDYAIDDVTKELQSRVQASRFDAVLQVNTKDREGGCYLAPFGTALGKSDCGAVGRGNRQGGIISAFRPANVEAPAGKNPLHHVGKLYTEAAGDLSDRVWAQMEAKVAITLVTSNGIPIGQPEHVLVESGRHQPDASEVQVIVSDYLSGINELGERLVRSPLAESGWTVLPGHDS